MMKIESVQYNACLAITGAIRGTSKKKLYDELCLESLQLSCWFKNLYYFYYFTNINLSIFSNYFL